MTALRGYRIIDLAERVAGEYCAKLLADFGAEVIKVERPGTGSPTRAMFPQVGEGGVESGGVFAYLNTNKKSVTLDVADAADRETIHRLIETADAVIDDHDDDWLKALGIAPKDVESRHPNVIFCSITPFGLGASRELRPAKSFSVFNTSGWAYHTPTQPDVTRPPLKGPGRFVADYEGGLDAAMCVASSLYWRKRSGEGQYIDVSQHEVLVSRADIMVGRMIVGEDNASDQRAAYDMAGPAAFFPAADGFVYLFVTTPNHWRGLKELLGKPEWMDAFEDNWLEFAVTKEKVATFRQGFGEWMAKEPKEDASERAQRLGIPLVPVNDASDLPRNAQFVHREFFQKVTHPVLGEALYPTVPYKMSASPVVLADPAPLLGQHNDTLAGQTKAPAESAAE